MNQHNNRIYIGITEAHIYHKIRKRCPGRIVSTKLLKNILMTTIFSSSRGRGGVIKGMPKAYLWDFIDDLQVMGLIRKINDGSYEILPSDCEKKLKRFIWD